MNEIGEQRDRDERTEAVKRFERDHCRAPLAACSMCSPRTIPVSATHNGASAAIHTRSIQTLQLQDMDAVCAMAPKNREWSGARGVKRP